MTFPKSNILFHGIFAIGILISLASCKTQNLFATGGASAVLASADSSFYKTTLHYEYTIRKDDKISISVWDNDDASIGSAYGIYNSNEVYGKWLMVDGRGDINVPKIGPLKAEGRTIIEMEDTLRSIYAEWIKRPIVDVKVLNKQVIVMGEMNSPGKFILEKDNNTLLEILATAGDFSFYANKRKVQVIRMIDGQMKEIVIDLTRKDDFVKRNIRIIPGDIVYVPAKTGKDLDKRFSTVLPLVSVITAFVIIYKTFF